MSSSISQHFTLTLTGVAQVLPTSVTPGAVRWLSMQPDAANANPVYLGGTGVTAANYGTRIPAPVAGVPPPPHIIGEFQDGMVRLDAFYVIGTNTEKLHLHVLTFPPSNPR